MNTGTISSRYAKALLKLVAQTGRGDIVYDQVKSILSSPSSFRAELEPEVRDFVALLVSNGRMEYVRFIFNSFCRMYEESHNRKTARLTTALNAPQIETRIKKLLEESTGAQVKIESRIDPSIIGGFILEVDDKLLDASVSGQIMEISKHLAETKSRIV